MNYHQSLKRLLEKIDAIENLPNNPDDILGGDVDLGDLEDALERFGKAPNWKGRETDLTPIGVKNKSQSGDDQSGDDQSGDGQPGDDEKARAAKDKEIEDKLSRRGDNTMADLEKKQADQKQKQADQLQKPDLTTTKNEEDIKPAFNWKSLISQFVSNAAPPETTYTRPASRAATQVSIAQQRGAAAVKPGERPGEEIYKLAFVFDTSGSMSGAIGPALSEARNLLKMQKASTNATLGICFFAHRYLLVEANLMSNTGWKVDSFKNMGRLVPATEKKSLDIILRSSDTGGTYFGPQLAGELTSIASKGFNIIVFSDTDILADNNWKNFLSLWTSNKRQVFFIAPNLSNYQAIIKKLGIKPNNFGHM